MKRIIVFLLCALLFAGAFSGCAGGARKTATPDLAFSSKPQTYQTAFSDEDGSPTLRLDAAAAEAFEAQAAAIEADFPYRALYGVDACFDRIFTDCAVTRHECSALDANGELTAEHLRDLVRENNRQFRESGEYINTFFQDVSDEYLLALCQLIVDTITEMQKRCPEIDYARVYCNLAALKVFVKVSSLDFAAVTPDMLLELGNGSLKIADLMADGSGVRNVLVHEIMHVIQYGCSCEKIDHCERHAGITYCWDDVSLQGNDWQWLPEASAEQYMTLLTGEEAMTYQEKINYLQSVNLATFLVGDIPANYAETICFYNDPERLFRIFRADSREEITEVAELMEAIQIIQYLPSDFRQAYEEAYGADLSTDEEAAKVRIALKPALCLAFSKAFYRNLAYALAEREGITAHDLYYLLRLFEAAMEVHTKYTDPERLEINQPFLDGYKALRAAFFRLLQENGAAVDEASYLAYEPFTADRRTVNASFRWLEADKKTFLLERTEYLSTRLDTALE